MYKIKQFPNLKGIKFNSALIEDHLKLYEGYVNSTNELRDMIDSSLDTIETETPAYSELQRRFSWEYNGMVLHELYFGNLINNTDLVPNDDDVLALINKQYGSLETWSDEFKSLGKTRGIGWVALYRLPDGSLQNGWINEHNEGVLVDAKILLVMDVFEHAFIKQYGLDRKAYIDDFFESIDWFVVEERFHQNMVNEWGKNPTAKDYAEDTDIQ